MASWKTVALYCVFIGVLLAALFRVVAWYESQVKSDSSATRGKSSSSTKSRNAATTTTQFVTCGSVVKLRNGKFNARLHSHEVKYGSGSGQQSVTGKGDIDDHNSYWAVRSVGAEPCRRGEPVKCGAKARLQHLSTKCHLHSHFFESPLSHNQEVSCFGDENAGDSGDNWEVQCDGDYWERDDAVRFKHTDTGLFLGTSNNQYGRPIRGQMEICALSGRSSATDWVSKEGIYVMPSDSASFSL